MLFKTLFKHRQVEPMSPAAGFTILETIFGIFVFSVGILAVASMQTKSLSANLNAINITKAVTSEMSLIADLRPVKYSDAEMTGDSETGQTHAHATSGLQTVTYHVRRLDVFNGDAAVITANATWNDRGRQHAESLNYFKIDEYLD